MIGSTTERIAWEKAEALRLEAMQPDLEKQAKIYTQILKGVADWNRLQKKIDRPGRLETRIV